MRELTCLEICAGAGGQSLGLERAGFIHAAAVEVDLDAYETLQINRPEWNPLMMDIRKFKGALLSTYVGVDLLAGGVPCPPFSIAGKQLGADDERDLFPEALRLVATCKPKAVMLENVRGLSTARFAPYLAQVIGRLDILGYDSYWNVLNASDFGIPQLRPRFVLVGMRKDISQYFQWPQPLGKPPTVGAVLRNLMAADGWPGADAWAAKANDIAPTLVGGSRKHGGPDLGPTRARQAWLKLHVDGKGLANTPPQATDPVDHIPRLTLPMAAVVQGFPPEWQFWGRKTTAYRQIGNAFPPAVACAVGESILAAIVAFESASTDLQNCSLPLAV